VGIYVLVVPLTVILVISFKDVRLDVEIQGFSDVLFVLDVKGDGEERLLPLADVGEFLLQALGLIADVPLDSLLQQVLLISSLQQLFYVVAEEVVELVGVLLDPDVDGLPKDLEGLDEALRRVVLLLRLLQVRKDLLHLVQDTLF